MTVTVAVTGGIGAGKSTVSGLLAARGAIVVDSDRLAREVVLPGTPGLSAVVDEFGVGVQATDGSLDRPALASIVFADAAARTRLEAITHPLIRAAFAEVRTAAPPGSVVVNDIPLLTTRLAAAAFHLVVGVTAAEDVRIARLIGRGMTAADARARIAAQVGDDARRPLCDVWLDNGRTPGDIRRSADLLWARLVEFAGNVQAGRRAARVGPAMVPYDPSWPAQAARVAARLHHLVGDGHRVEHIGSTAVPGMPAKDVLDLQLAVDDLDQADALADVLTQGGFPLYPGITEDTAHVTEDTARITESTVYADSPDPAGRAIDGSGWRKRLHANADPGRSVNLHLRVRGAPNWIFALRMREWLRADPAAAENYLVLKRTLADRYADDATVARYAEAKEDFLDQAGVESAAWAAARGWKPG